MVGHDSHDYQQPLGLLANLQDGNNTTKETTMENTNQPTYDELFTQLQATQRELSDTKVMLERVNSIGERNSHRLRQSLITIRQLIVAAREDNKDFVYEHRQSIDQLVSFGMEDFTKKMTITASWIVTLDVEATVPEDYEEDDIELYIEEDIDRLFTGSFFDDSRVESDNFDSSVELRSWNVKVEGN